MSSLSKPSRQSANRSGKRTFYIDVDTGGLDALMDELEGDVQAAVRPMTQAGAQVFYEAVQANVSRLGSKTGNLYASIYQAFSPDKSTDSKAVYHISWRTSGNGVRAPHGHLVEFGHIQRYASYIGGDGQWHTAVRPEMRGKPRPRRNASQAVKDAYYVLRKGGPVQVAAHPFVRPAATSAKEQAITAMKTTLFDLLGAK